MIHLIESRDHRLSLIELLQLLALSLVSVHGSPSISRGSR